MRIGVLMGGHSSEREVSIMTGKEIIKYIDKEKYEVKKIIISSEGETLEKVKEIDFCFLALHGSFGEDGRIQSILESLGIPYSGSGVLSSALCMDKNLSKKIFKAECIPTPKWFTIRKNEISLLNLKNLNIPIVVKPNSGGSSIGTFIPKSFEDLNVAINEVMKYDNEILIEEYVEGQEITCSILDDIILPIISIKPTGEFFNYSEKYNDDGADERVISINPLLYEKISKITKKCWRIFKLKAYARIDMIIKGDEVYVLEINTLPGLTSNSLFPKSAKAFGLDFTMLLDKIIELSYN
jgi:D-alanine-D-alanine ligase